MHVLQDKSSTLQPEFDHIEYCEIVIKSYFEAMDRDHKDAADYFTRLLELIETYPETGPLFKEYVSYTGLPETRPPTKSYFFVVFEV